MSEQKNDIEIFDSEEDIIIEPLNNAELYDIKGNLITADDARNTLPDNTDLIQKAINGDKKAFETLYMQSYRYVFFVVRQFIPDDETTYDAIQETFVKVYKSIGRLRSPAAYYGWITVIAKNTARDFMRTARFEASLSYKEEDYSAFLKDDETQKDVTLDIESVLKKLDPADADLLSLVYYDGMRIARIAKMQGVPATTVYSRFNKAKRNLKSQLNARGIDKAIYSGNFISMITVAIRNIIGTALLSVAIAQQILDSIINGKGKKELAVAKVIRAQQKKAILKIASVIVAISMVTSAVTALTLIDRTRFKFSGDDNYLTSTVTEYYYETVSGDGNSSQDSGGFWQNLFGGGNTSSDGSSNTDSSNNSENSYNSPYYSNSSAESSSSNASSKNPSSNYSPNGSSSRYVSSSQIIDPAHSVTDTVVNTYGNNPNNVMRYKSYGVVAKQGDYLYYDELGNLIKMKTDGSEKQVLCEMIGILPIRDINVIGDTIYYTMGVNESGFKSSGGIYSIKTDGTDKKRICAKGAYNLLVKGTTGWYVEISSGSNPPNYTSYDLYQIDLQTGETILLVEDGKGYGLKTVIDNVLVYIDDNVVYSRDLTTGIVKELLTIEKPSIYEFNINNMLVSSDTLYINYDYQPTFNSNYTYKTVRLDINKPQDITEAFSFNDIYNYFNDDVMMFARYNDSYNFFSLDGISMCEENGNIYYDDGIYSFDDGYAYFFNNDGALCRCITDGTGFKTYPLN